MIKYEWRQRNWQRNLPSPNQPSQPNSCVRRVTDYVKDHAMASSHPSPGGAPLCGGKPETIRQSNIGERPADWEIGDTAGWETCGTVAEAAAVRGPLAPNRHHLTMVSGKAPVTE